MRVLMAPTLLTRPSSRPCRSSTVSTTSRAASGSIRSVAMLLTVGTMRSRCWGLRDTPDLEGRAGRDAAALTVIRRLINRACLGPMSVAGRRWVRDRSRLAHYRLLRRARPRPGRALRREYWRTGLNRQAAEPDTRAGLRWPGLLLVLMCSTQFLNVANISSVNIALPDIAAELGFNQATLPWVVSAYLLTFAGFLLVPPMAVIGRLSRLRPPESASRPQLSRSGVPARSADDH